MRHKHADMIIQWAEGAEIEYFYEGQWWETDAPQWSEEWEYRIKPVEPAWFEAIPPHGVLVWWRNKICVCLERNSNSGMYRIQGAYGESFLTDADTTPLSDDEISKFLRGG